MRDVRGEDLLRACGGVVDVLDGSPPCTPFSMSGRREKTWGRERRHAGLVQRVDDLFFEFARLVREAQPAAFVAENVAGLTRGKSRGYFKEILRELKSCGYAVEARLLDAQWLGVPQRRERVIIVGVRLGLGARPRFPRPLPYRYRVADACPWMRASVSRSGGFAEVVTPSGEPVPTVTATQNRRWAVERLSRDGSSIERTCLETEWRRLRPGETSGRYYQLERADPERPCPIVTESGEERSTASIAHPAEPRKFTILELKRVCGFSDDYPLRGSYAQQWRQLGNSVPPPMMEKIVLAIATALEAAR